MTRGRKQKALDQFERLEERLHWSVSQDVNGWTVVNNPTASIVYVSSSTGDDNNAGTISSPVKTLRQAQNMSVSGPNEILLKSGDVFNNDSTNSNVFNNWTLSGQNADAPFLISYYGTGARPLINSGTAGVAFSTGNYTTAGTVVNYLDVIGLQFDANLRDTSLGTVSTSAVGGNKGFEFYANGGNTLVEDCSFTYYGENFDIESLASTNHPAPSSSNITIRRTVSANAYAFNGGRSQGLYAFNISGITVDQCDFDHNGWNETPGLGATDIGFNHNMYFASTNSGVTVKNTITAEASYAGIMARAGGDIDNNLFIDDAVACAFGDADGADSTVGGVSGSLIGNTIVGDKASQSLSSHPLAFGQGFVIANTNPNSNVVVSGNLFTADTQNAKAAIQLALATGTTNKSATVGINNLTITNNIANGWRIGIQTDGRFVPGGTGLFALNNLKVSKNDFVNSSTQEVRHDGTFSSAQESWSADRYYDSRLAQNKWITLTSNSLAYPTWVSTYDLGAVALSTLPYTDPSRTVATYDTTVGGTGTWQDYLTNARQLSITNYTPQYMATAAASYVQAGFFIVSGTAAPTALATTTNVNVASLGATTYSFAVNFTGGSLIKALSTGNVLVTGPNGFSQKATFVSVAPATMDSSGYEHTAAVYRITPTTGKWATGQKQEGTYTISLLANQVSDLSGLFVPDGVLGTFAVDLTPPTTAVISPDIAVGSTGYAFSITYADATGIDPNTLYSGEVQVTGPNGYSQFATLTSITPSSSGGGIVANYSITAPGSGSNPPPTWTTSASGVYTIALAVNSVYDLAGNPVAGGTLSTFSVGSSSVLGSITGVVFNDSNNNGVMDGREMPLAGATLFIDVAGNGVYTPGDPIFTTDSTGTYTIPQLVAGRYAIVETAPDGYTPTAPASGANIVTLTAGQNATANFANQINGAVISGIGANPASSGTAITPTDPVPASPVPVPPAPVPPAPTGGIGVKAPPRK